MKSIAGVGIPLVVVGLFAFAENWSPAPRRQFAAPHLEPGRMKAGVWEYATRWSGPYNSGDAGSLELAVYPCLDATTAAWCIVTGSDTTKLARSTLEPLYTAAGAGGSRTTTRYSPDTVRTDYLLEVSDGAAVEPRHVTVQRRPGAWPETIASDVLAALALPAVHTLLALQPRRDEVQDVDRSFPGEDREMQADLADDIAVAWSEGRDSGLASLRTPTSAADISVPYRATIVSVRYPDRAVRLWVTDSTRTIVRRETRFRAGDNNAVLIDSLVATTAPPVF